MTPKRVAAYIALAVSAERREAGQQLSIGAMAARGDPRAVRKQIRDLSEDR